MKLQQTLKENLKSEIPKALIRAIKMFFDFSVAFTGGLMMVVVQVADISVREAINLQPLDPLIIYGIGVLIIFGNTLRKKSIKKLKQILK